MARPPRPPRRTQREFLVALEELFSTVSFGAHLAAKGMGDPSLVSRCRTGDRHLRFDELLELLAHLGDDAGTALEWLANRSGFTVVRLPAGENASSAMPIQQLRIEALTGELSRLIADGFDPDGDGGHVLTPAEAAAIERSRRLLQQLVADLGESLQPHLCALAR